MLSVALSCRGYSLVARDDPRMMPQLVTQDTTVTSASPLSTIFLGSVRLCTELLVYFGRAPSSFIEVILTCHRACLKILMSVYAVPLYVGSM